MLQYLVLDQENPEIGPTIPAGTCESPAAKSHGAARRNEGRRIPAAAGYTGRDSGAGDVSLKYITKAKTEAKQEEIAGAKRAASKMGLQNGRYPDGIDKDIEKKLKIFTFCAKFDPNATYYEEFLVTLSCAARNASKYVVINLTEKERCKDVPEDTRPCAPDGLNTYNTNVVFDRQGVVVSRYRKVHVLGENKNSTYLPELITFETDFGVTFGQFICFDILFYTPARQLVVEQGVTDFVLPAMWYSQLPFLTAVQVQEGWAYSNDVNLLAAGASNPLIGNSGSGIYHGRSGALTRVMRQDLGERTIYVAQVPKYPRSRSVQKRAKRETALQARTPRQVANSSSYLMKRDDVENYETELLQFDERASGNVSRTLCQGSFCCHFDIAWRSSLVAENGSYYSYRLGTYDGWRTNDTMDANYIRNCGLFACSGPTIGDCGQLLGSEGAEQQTSVTFTRLAIGVIYPESLEFLLSPNSLLSNLLPLEPSQFEWSQQKPSENSYQHEVRFIMREPLELSNLLTFAVYGNYYDNECTFGVGSEEEQQACGYRSSSSRIETLGGFQAISLAILILVWLRI
ncbi:vanin-like protein 1 [Drosophila kikkawai]|uniref:Vanin-like protein 1 n=1 Tax=Drosophila kikkawai TaxID=30033 RepID=A0A6P4IKG6_DROKI|nr:vanin-like protein 1 [Drosophila kikkawai]